MSAVVVIATLRPLPEHRAEDDRLVMAEKWSSAEALAEHSRGPALAGLNQALAGRLGADLDVPVLRPHPAGTPAQGSV